MPASLVKVREWSFYLARLSLHRTRRGFCFVCISSHHPWCYSSWLERLVWTAGPVILQRSGSLSWKSPSDRVQRYRCSLKANKAPPCTCEPTLGRLLSPCFCLWLRLRGIEPVAHAWEDSRALGYSLISRRWKAGIWEMEDKSGKNRRVRAFRRAMSLGQNWSVWNEDKSRSS